MKKNMILLAILLGLAVIGVGVTWGIRGGQNSTAEENQIKIVTSFYPMYVATQNIVDGMDNVELVNLAENQTGCLHDYQLTTNDMRKLENADVFIMNGGGMEGFIEEIAASYPNLTIINASEGISLLESQGHGHHHEDAHGEEEHHDDAEEEQHEDAEEEHEHEHESNAHVWLNPELYEKQIENIAQGLAKVDKQHEKEYGRGKDVYLSAIESVKFNLKEQLATINNDKVIIFHDAFAYLAEFLGLDVVYEVDMDSDSGLSAGDIKEVIDEVKEHDIKVLFTEEQFSDSIADSIAKETDAKVYVIDSLVTGDGTKESYISGMNKNISVLKEALS